MPVLTFTEEDFAPRAKQFTEADFDAPKTVTATTAIPESAAITVPVDEAALAKDKGVFQPSQFGGGASVLQPGTDGDVVSALKLPFDATSAVVGALQEHVIEPLAHGLNKVNPLAIALEKLTGTELKEGESVIPKELLPFGEPDEKGVLPAATRVLQGLTTEGSLATLPLAGLKSVQAVYGAGIVSSLPDSVQRFLEAATPDEQRDAATDLGFKVGFGLLIAKGLKGKPADAPIVESLKEANAPVTAEVVRAVIPETKPAEAPLNPGGSLKDLSPELQAQSNAVKEQMMAGFRPAKPPAEPPPDTGPTEFPTSGENVAMRKSAARAVDSPSIPEPVQEVIAKAPESFYKQQSTAEVSKTVGGMLDNDLAGVPRDSNLYVAAKLEQAKRLFNAGKNDEGYEAFVQLEKEGTRLGQLINQFKFLDSVNPSSVATIIDKRLVKAGRDPLTEPQRTKVIDATKASQEASRALETAKNDWMKKPTDENAVKAEDALNKSNDLEVELQRMVDRYEVRTIPGTLSTILKGNLLTPISQIANVIGNVSFIPFRSSARAVASVLDVVDAYVRNRPREIAVSPIEGTKAAVKGIAKGVSQIPDIALRGSSTIKGERSTGLHPLRAWIDQFSSNPDVPTIGGKVPLSDRVRMALEGTFGVPAETMLRGLAAGDRPFRESAQARIIANEAKLAKIPRENLEMAQKFPELFFDRPTLERIQEETLGAIFQRQSNSIRTIIKLFNTGGNWGELGWSTIAPYKLTPWNIASEILSYNPLVAGAQIAYFSVKGQSRAAKLSAGKLVVGSMLTAAAHYLYKQGLLSPSMDSPDERTKARVLAGEIMPPNHINVSGVGRLMAGGDPAFKTGDKTVDVFRAGGLFGSMAYMTANIGRDMEKQPASEDDILVSLLRNSTIEQARFAMNQSFLQGVGGLFEAIKDGDTDGMVKKWANTTMSIALPNTLNTMSRATRPEKIQVDGFEDLLRSRLGVFGTDDKLPLKRGLWGEPIPETPEGRNALIYHFFDITKGRQVTDDPVAIEIYKLWRASNDTSVIPTPPSRSITFNKQAYTLNAEQQSNLSELVGKARRAYAEAMVSNPEWENLPAEFKIKVLGQVYDKGLEVGKAQYFLTEPNLEPKKKPAGFNN